MHRAHAIINMDADTGDFSITDLSGRDGNGIWVNGSKIQVERLHHDDLIELGTVRLRYYNLDARAAAHA